MTSESRPTRICAWGSPGGRAGRARPRPGSPGAGRRGAGRRPRSSSRPGFARLPSRARMLAAGSISSPEPVTPSEKWPSARSAAGPRARATISGMRCSASPKTSSTFAAPSNLRCGVREELRLDLDGDDPRGVRHEVLDVSPMKRADSSSVRCARARRVTAGASRLAVASGAFAGYECPAAGASAAAGAGRGAAGLRAPGAGSARRRRSASLAASKRGSAANGSRGGAARSSAPERAATAAAWKIRRRRRAGRASPARRGRPRRRGAEASMTSAARAVDDERHVVVGAEDAA